MRFKPLAAAVVTALSFTALPGWAAWPDDKPIEVVVGFAPGGGTDLMARKLLPFVQRRLGPNAQFIVVNKPGAAGELANGYAARAKADGYTLAVVNMPSFFFVPMTKKSQYQPEEFQLIARVVDDPTVLAVRAESKFDSLQALVTESRQRPGSVSLGHNGAGTNGELAIHLLGRAAGVQLNPIAYKGTAAQKTDLLGGHLDVALVSAGELPELHGGGKGQVRGLAQLMPKRTDVLPQVPTATEAGLQILMSSERGFAAPKGVPADILKRLEQAIAEALKDPEFLGTSTDDKVISFLPGAQWQRSMDQGRKALLPLADSHPKN
ncbi:tripartite tricarboxylate transporter substrate binding protein [Paenacidovorax monticola]|uniref:Tripartite tricarboxylate transporter substrate binding protein n=1 Tax=Paenacidovorax monticola TaxID=1926868 RepID=A0A7H0HDQ3_9BURK|nr:tripartite tricarboxylate transporter substrate binding protein [Paenacidovorax monticola]QNP58669.1 tripartite tricarboxylate transporter substrate binding protein [Paenacidovorax monticola]